MIADVEAIAKSKRLAALVEKREQFNAAHPIGSYVRWSQSLPDGQWLVSPTTTKAFLWGHGIAVHVLQCSQPVYLSNLLPLPAELVAAIVSRPPAVGVREERPARLPAGRPGFLDLPVGDRD